MVLAKCELGHTKFSTKPLSTGVMSLSACQVHKKKAASEEAASLLQDSTRDRIADAHMDAISYLSKVI